MENKKRYYSCNIIEHGFDAQFNSINLCCRVGNGLVRDKLRLINNYNGQKIDWKEFFKIKNQLREIQKSGKTIPYCKGCIYLHEEDWNQENIIHSININNWIKCNANCIYCDRNEYLRYKEYKIYPIIKDLIKYNYLQNPADITIAGGEPTITRDFDKTIKLLIQHNITPVRILTNAIKYNKNIEKGLEKGLVNILISTDSGTRETYKKIKLVDKHKDVWKNISKYTKHQQTNSLVKTKFIIIPSINDNKYELKEFIIQNQESRIKYTCIDVEIGWFDRNNNNTDKLIELYNLYLYAKEEGKKRNIEVSAFDRMQIIEQKVK